MPRRFNAYAQFRHSLQRGDLHLAWTTALEIPGGLQLDDALDLLALAHAKGSPKYGRAAALWVARLISGDREVDLEEVALVVEALADPADELATRVRAVLHRPDHGEEAARAAQA